MNPDHPAPQTEGLSSACPDREFRTAQRTAAFTLVELLVAMTITTILLTLLVQMLGMTQQTWTRTKSQSAAFRDARAAFENITRQLSQATLNSYWDYDDPVNPTYYQRQSELHYVSGPTTTLLTPAAGQTSGHAAFFQAPIGLSHLADTVPGAGLDQALNAWGYFVQYNSDLPQRPSFMDEATSLHPERKRFRLMEFHVPTERFNLYQLPDTTAGSRPTLATANTAEGLYSWFRTPLTTSSEALAENILALIIQPIAPGATALPANYLYDTRAFQLGSILTEELAATKHQLPPTVRVTLVALDEASWSRLNNTDAIANQLVQKVNTTLFQRPGDFDEDLQSLTSQLTGLKLDHRVFTTTVSIRSAKWHSDKSKAVPLPP